MSEINQNEDEKASEEIAVIRARAEVELLAAWAGGPRRGRAILADLEISPASFAEPDTSAIARILWAAGEPLGAPMPTKIIARACAEELIDAGLWHADERSFIGGMIRGPGSLAAMLSRVPFDPHGLALAACRLADAIEKQNELAQRYGRAA